MRAAVLETPPQSESGRVRWSEPLPARQTLCLSLWELVLDVFCCGRCSLSFPKASYIKPQESCSRPGAGAGHSQDDVWWSTITTTGRRRCGGCTVSTALHHRATVNMPYTTTSSAPLPSSRAAAAGRRRWLSAACAIISAWHHSQPQLPPPPPTTLKYTRDASRLWPDVRVMERREDETEKWWSSPPAACKR